MVFDFWCTRYIKGQNAAVILAWRDCRKMNALFEGRRSCGRESANIVYIQFDITSGWGCEIPTDHINKVVTFVRSRETGTYMWEPAECLAWHSSTVHLNYWITVYLLS